MSVDLRDHTERGMHWVAPVNRTGKSLCIRCPFFFSYWPFTVTTRSHKCDKNHSAGVRSCRSWACTRKSLF